MNDTKLFFNNFYSKDPYEIKLVANIYGKHADIILERSLKMEILPWNKFQFSSEHIYLRENIQDFDLTHCVRYSK